MHISHLFSWFCLFDDDMYVNYPQLVTLLGKYNPYTLGKNYTLGKIRQKMNITINLPKHPGLFRK